jgi:hypothetical protein
LEGNIVLITSLLPFLIHLCEADSLLWTRYLEKFLFCLGDNRTRFWKRLVSELSIRYYGFLHRTNTECKVVHATNSVTPSFSLETIKSNSGNKSSFFETFKRLSLFVYVYYYVSEHFCLLILEGNIVLMTSLLSFLIHLCEADSLLWSR